MYVMMTLRGKDTNVGEIVGKYKTEENERIIKSYYRCQYIILFLIPIKIFREFVGRKSFKLNTTPV